MSTFGYEKYSDNIDNGIFLFSIFDTNLKKVFIGLIGED